MLLKSSQKQLIPILKIAECHWQRFNALDKSEENESEKEEE